MIHTQNKKRTKEKQEKITSILTSSKILRIFKSWKIFTDKRAEYKEAILIVQRNKLSRIFSLWFQRGIESVQNKVRNFSEFS